MATNPGTLVHKDHGHGLRIEIRDSGELRSLYFADGQLQSRINMARPWELVVPYTRYMAGALLLVPNPRRILLIGLGAGALVQFFVRHVPECQMTCVENSPLVIQLARGFFRLPNEPRITMECCDGFDYLMTATPGYDLLLVDAFDQEGMAASIYRQEFFEQCARLLNQDGVMACNLWSGNRLLFKDLQETLAASFASLWQLPVPERGNVVVWASRMEQPWLRLPTRSRDLTSLSRRYGLDFREIVATAKGNNLNLAQRLLLAFR